MILKNKLVNDIHSVIYNKLLSFDSMLLTKIISKFYKETRLTKLVKDEIKNEYKSKS